MSINMPSIGGSTVEHFPTPKISRNLTRFSLPAIKFHILLVSPFNHTTCVFLDYQYLSGVNVLPEKPSFFYS